MRDWTYEASVHISKMNIQIAAARRSPRFGHVLREDFARANPFNEDRAQVSNQRRDEVFLIESVRTADCGRLLAQRSKHATHNFGLPVQVDEAFFNKPCQL